VQQGAVDAATGFANNEPVQLELTGTDVVVLHVDDVVALPGPGIISATATLEQSGGRRAVRRRDAARDDRDRRDPKVGLDAAIAAVPELGRTATPRRPSSTRRSRPGRRSPAAATSGRSIAPAGASITT
jgi:hypothetical protein